MTFGASRARSVMLALLFVLSGLTALVYEVVWFKRFAHVFGSAPIAVGAVVASFLLGVGLGAHRVGVFADRVRRPFRAYGFFELGIGLLALAVPLELAVLRAVEVWAYPLAGAYPLVGALLRFALAFVVIGPPCFLMGGTLPLLVKAFAGLGVGIGRSAGMLYALNTLGAALGAYLAGFHLLPELGIQTTTWLASATSVGIALGAFALAPGLERSCCAAAPPPVGARGERWARAWLPPALAWAAGCAALVLQIVWMRQMALLVGGTTYAFSAVLAVILLGIGLGSLIFRVLLERGREPRRVVQGLLVAVAGATVVGQRSIPTLVDLVAAAVELRGSAFYNALVCVLAGTTLAFLPSLAFGCLFPAIVTTHFRAAGTEGRTVGAIAWWNLFGCLVGAAATPLVLVPAVGTAASVGIAVGLCGAALVLAGGLDASFAPVRVSAALVAAGLLTAAAARPLDPLRLNLGAYSYGYVPFEERREDVLYFAEGRTCNVLVTGHPSVALRLNGKVDAGAANDMPTQLGLAYFPRVLRPDARDALVLGFGSGTTCGASLLFPGTYVTCCELEEEVFRAARFFAHVNHEPQRSDRFAIRFVDGRSHVQGTREQYDLIVSEPPNPWIAGVGNLFTRSFYEAARDRLRGDGLFVQWMQTYEMPAEDYALVLRTVAAVFEHCGVIRIDDLDTLVVASDAALLPSGGDLARAQALIDGTPAVRQDLERYFGTTSVGRLLGRHFLVGPAGVRRILGRDGGTALHTDDNLRLEFDVARRLFAYTPETDALVLAGVEPEWQRELFEVVPDRDGLVAEWPNVVDVVEAAGLDSGRELAALGYRLAQDVPFFLMRETLEDPPPDEEAFRFRVARLAETAPDVANLLGSLYWDRGDHARAARVFDVMLARWPGSATLWANLSIARRSEGREEDAAAALLRALELDPLNEFATRTQRSGSGDP